MSKGISTVKKMWLGVAVLAIISPIGIILPDKLKAGSAWGEWGPDELEKMLGYVPQGLKKLSELWNAPMPDYDFKGWGGTALGMQSLGYITSAVIGIAVIVAVIMLLGKITMKDK